jgi:hypothetical protein
VRIKINTCRFCLVRALYLFLQFLKSRTPIWHIAVEGEEPEADSELEVARVAEEVIKGSGKRGRKRKSAAPEADEKWRG